MNHSTVSFRGIAALPGAFLSITRVNRGNDYFFSLTQTSHSEKGWSFSPLSSIAYHLDNRTRDYPIKKRIIAKGWKVGDCAFRMWLIGSIGGHPACISLSFEEGCELLWILAALIKEFLESKGHETIYGGFEPFGKSNNEKLNEIARILFGEFLREIAELLLEDMDLDSMNLYIDNQPGS